MTTKMEKGTELYALARAKAMNLSVSTKHSVEISRFLRYKKTSLAKQLLEEVIQLKRAVPFNRYKHNVGHRAGMAAGRYPEKAAREFLRLIKSAEANAQMKGLDPANLKITKILANKASIPMTGGRHRRGTKRTHLELEVREFAAKKKGESKLEKKVETRAEKAKPAASPAVNQIEEKKIIDQGKVSLPKVEEQKEKTFVAAPEKKSQLLKSEPSKPVVGSKFTPSSSVATKSESKKMPEAKEVSPQDLLAMAQKKAAELNQRQRQDQKVKEVENLYEQLQKKGSLRSSPGVNKSR